MSAQIRKQTYVRVWAVLLVLLFVTWATSRLDLTPFNIIIALTISVAKMAFIILYFMHVRFGPRLLWVFVGAGFVWLLIMIELTMSDYLTRGFSWSQ
jgi:cytochrome c oxidase subunit IV